MIDYIAPVVFALLPIVAIIGLIVSFAVAKKKQ
jgi:hypothetical protein